MPSANKITERITSVSGIRTEEMRYVYSLFDVQISTSWAEGFGLTPLEGMACGVPQIVPDFAALGDWARPAAHLVKCSEFFDTWKTASDSNPRRVILLEVLLGGAVPDENEFAAALELIYRDKDYRADLRRRGLELVNQPRFRWENIAAEFHKVFQESAPATNRTILARA